MGRPVLVPDLTPEERTGPERRVGAPTTSRRDCLRARIVLLRADGCSLQEAARQLGVSVPCAHKGSQRFDLHGLPGLVDKPGRGRRRSNPDRTVKRIIEMAGQAPPGRQRWSTNSVAAAVGVSSDTVSCIWRTHGLKPHRTRTFKVSGHPRCEQKFRDVIGLYLDPPERSLVLCCDQETPCQALERTQPCPPLGAGHVRVRTHDSIRLGTITLFAALNYLDGKLLYRTEQKHSHVERLRFLKRIEHEAPRDVEIHLIADNYSRHKHAKVKAWLARRKRFHMHFVPTSSSWTNLIERFFAEVTEACVRPGSFASVAQLVETITVYLAQRNANPKPYRWTADGKEILARIRRARSAMDQRRARQPSVT